MAITRGWRKGGGVQCLMGTELQLGRRKTFADDCGDGYTTCDYTSCHHAVHLKMIKIVKFMLCVFHHNFLNSVWLKVRQMMMMMIDRQIDRQIDRLNELHDVKIAPTKKSRKLRPDPCPPPLRCGCNKPQAASPLPTRCIPGDLTEMQILIQRSGQAWMLLLLALGPHSEDQRCKAPSSLGATLIKDKIQY